MEMGKEQRELLPSGASSSGRKGGSEVPEEAGGGLVTGRQWILKHPVLFGQKGAAALWVESALKVRGRLAPRRRRSPPLIERSLRRSLGGAGTSRGASVHPQGRCRPRRPAWYLPVIRHPVLLRIGGTPAEAAIGRKGQPVSSPALSRISTLRQRYRRRPVQYGIRGSSGRGGEIGSIKRKRAAGNKP